MFGIFKALSLRDCFQLETRASELLAVIDSPRSTRKQVVNACDKLLQCGQGLTSYDRVNPLKCGNTKAWLENGSVRIQKLN